MGWEGIGKWRKGRGGVRERREARRVRLRMSVHLSSYSQDFPISIAHNMNKWPFCTLQVKVWG